MDRQATDDTDLTRRAVLDRASTAFRVVLLAAVLWPQAAVRADDDDDDDDDDGGDDGGGGDDSSDDDDEDDDDDDDDDSGGDSESSGSGNGNSGRGGDDDDDFRRGTLDQSDAVQAVRTGKAIPLKTALKKVESRYRGAVIDVTLRSTGRRLEYRFKIRTERGSVRTIRMDAGTGRFLGLGALFR